MTPTTEPRWKAMQTDETRRVEAALREDFDTVDTYRYNIASIRVRVIDARFEGMSRERRDDLVEVAIARLPEEIQRDIVNLTCVAPSELDEPPGSSRESLHNLEFEDPSPTML